MNDLVSGCNDVRGMEPSDLLHDLEGYTRYVLGHIPTMSAQELELTARQAFKMEGASFLIRTLCVARLVNLATAQQGGRGKKDDQEQGINATLRRLASDWNTSLRTLQADLAIHRVFFASALETSATDSLVCGLERGHFCAALSAQEPRTAIEMAKQRLQEGPYPIRQFKKDVATLGKKETAQVKRSQKVRPIRLYAQTVQRLDALRESMRSEYPQECGSWDRFVNFLLRHKVSGEM